MMTRVDTSAASAAVACTAQAGGGTTAAIARAVVIVAQIGLRVTFIDHQIDGHLAFQTTYVTLAKVVAQFVYLRERGRNR